MRGRHRQRPDRGCGDDGTAPGHGRPVRSGRAPPRPAGDRQPGAARSGRASTSWRTTPPRTGRSSAPAWPASRTRVAGFEAALREGIARGIVASRRQALACARAGRNLERRRRPTSATSPIAIPANRRLADAAEAARPSAYAQLGAVPSRRVRAGGGSGRPGRRRALRAVGARVQRHRPRSRGDVRLGMGRALPHRGRDAARRRTHPARRRAR